MPPNIRGDFTTHGVPDIILLVALTTIEMAGFIGTATVPQGIAPHPDPGIHACALTKDAPTMTDR
jgi:hypothetical protein